MNTGHLQAERAEKAQQEDKHTPGTWRRGTNTASKEWMQVFRQDGSMIAEVKTIHKRGQRERGDFQEEEANARLIAAAPDMLKALEDLFEHCSMIHTKWGEGCNIKEANAAIEYAKAVIARAK